MPERYYCETPIQRDRVVLEGAEARHMIRVMRAKPGDRVTLFDGSGAEFEAELLDSARHEATLAVLSRVEVDRESSRRLTLGVALPKGDRQKVLVEKLTELGVAALTPLLTARSVAAPKESGLEKLRRQVIEASKQCRRNRLMRIEEPTPLTDFLARDWGVADRLIAHPYDGEVRAPESLSGIVVVAVGPEGGFDDSEVALARERGWHARSLGPRILRVETAAIALAALCGVGDSLE